jgi:hypothetical protein
MSYRLGNKVYINKLLTSDSSEKQKGECRRSERSDWRCVLVSPNSRGLPFDRIALL